LLAHTQIDIEFPEDSGQPERKMVWSKGSGGQAQQDIAAFQLTRCGAFCNKEFMVEITIYPRQGFPFKF